MAGEFAVFVEGLEGLDFTKGMDAQIRRAAALGINKMARDYRAKAAREIRNEVNLPARLVSSKKGLSVTKKANRNDLEARITASGQPRSLARYVRGSPKPGRAGVYLEVAPGRVRFMKRGFLIRLPGTGGSTDEALANIGLAIRLRKGERLSNKVEARKVASGLYVLYGPSVDQIFRSRDGSGVASDLVPEIERDLSDEFIRLLEL